ncbi:hypothetical protein B0H14DRAFT_3738723 [Mycena olivaceomarginata]|nr:hypothetical protein B0H14DRAFT_3738723 [Mycena olivaceomarginata]
MTSSSHKTIFKFPSRRHNCRPRCGSRSTHAFEGFSTHGASDELVLYIPDLGPTATSPSLRRPTPSPSPCFVPAALCTPKSGAPLPAPLQFPQPRSNARQTHASPLIRHVRVSGAALTLSRGDPYYQTKCRPPTRSRCSLASRSARCTTRRGAARHSPPMLALLVRPEGSGCKKLYYLAQDAGFLGDTISLQSGREHSRSE